MNLTVEEILFILDKISNGKFGYDDNKQIGQLQAKLSIMLEVQDRLNNHSKPIKESEAGK